MAMVVMYSPSGEPKLVEEHMVGYWVTQGYSQNPPSVPPVEEEEEEEETSTAPAVTILPSNTTFGQTATGNVPGQWELYQIDGTYYLVYKAPGPNGGEIPIAYEIDDLTAVTQHFGVTLPELQAEAKVRTQEQWNAAGGIVMGYFNDIDLTTGIWSDPWTGFVELMEEQAILAPWLLDGEIWALAAAAYIEGRSLTEAELSGTEWWQTHNDNERAWLQLVSSNPSEAERFRDDTRRNVREMLKEAGINNGEDIMLEVNGREISLADWMADQFTFGTWSSEYIEDQIELLADPLLEGDRDTTLTGLLNGVGEVNTTRSREDKVQELFRTWLGPVFGAVDKDVVNEWASRFRDDPDAEVELVEYLQQQRLTLFPQYQDQSLTYNAIAGPWKNYLSQAWGLNSDEFEQDEFFMEMIRTNDSIEAGRMARKEGFKRGIDKVKMDALESMQQGFGSSIVRAMQ